MGKCKPPLFISFLSLLSQKYGHDSEQVKNFEALRDEGYDRCYQFYSELVKGGQAS